MSGRRGVISVVGNVVPADLVALLNAFDSGNLTKAQRWHRKLFALCRDMLSLSTNPIPIKAAMKMLGRDTGELRPPITPLTPAEETRLRATPTAYGLLQSGRMTRKASNRRGFSNRAEVLINVTIVGLAISAGLPFFEEVLSAGWPSWLAALVFPISFLVLIAYLLGVP